jgi:hypothetical protein
MFKLALSLLTIGCLLALTAAPASIGIVKSTGQFRVNGSAIPGNSNLFEGDVVETAGGRSIVQIGATQFTLLPESRAHIFRGRTVLEKGSGLFAGAPSYAVEAATLRIAPAAKNAVIQVEISAPNRISVATREGGAEVRNSSGVLVASLRSGMALAFDPQAAGASTALKIKGTVESGDGKFFLTDTTTNVKFELQGTDLAKYDRKCVEIAGSSIPGVTAAAGASQVCQVVTIQQVGCKKVAAAAGAAGAGAAGAGAAGAGAATGISAAATAAIIGGVAVAGVLGGLAAAGTFSGGGPVSNQ